MRGRLSSKFADGLAGAYNDLGCLAGGRGAKLSEFGGSSVEPSQVKEKRRRLGLAGVVGLAGLVWLIWLAGTPPGVLGKADAVGYALCHRISERSFHIGGRALPLCARCSGIYLGALLEVGVMLAVGRGRWGRLPPWPILVGLVGFVAAMGVDGVNSYLTLFPGLPSLYMPSNWLRLVTGTLNGLTIAGLVFPVFNQTVWQNWVDRAPLGRWRELAGLVGLAALAAGAVLTENPVVLYALALWSAAGVLVILTMLNTVFILLARRRENTYAGWRAAGGLLAGALTLAIVEIGLLDAARFAVFRSWDGFVFP